MKFISFTKANWKFLIFAVAYLVIMLLLNFMSFYLENLSTNMENISKKIPLMISINHFFLVFLAIKKCIDDRKDKKKIIKEEPQTESKIELIYDPNNNELRLSKRTIILVFVMFFLDYLYNGLLMYYQKKYKENASLVFSQFYKFLDLFFLLLLFKFFAKCSVYNFQYFSLSIIIISGLGKTFINIYFDKKINEEINAKFSLTSFIILFTCSILDSIKLYFFKNFMEYKYISPISIGYLSEFLYLIISSILMCIFFFVDFGVSDIKEYFSLKGLEFLKDWEFLLIAYSLFYSIEYFLDLIIINKFTPFHLAILSIFGELMIDCFNYYKQFPNWNNLELIISIILYIFEIIGILIFNGTIILKCFSLSKYTKNNIMIRGEEETNKAFNNLDRANSTLSGTELSEEGDDNNIH